MNKSILLLPAFLVGAAAASGQILLMESFSNTDDQAPITDLDNWNWAVDDGGGSDTGNRQFGRLSALNGVDGEPGFAYQFNGSGAARASVIWNDSVNFAQSAVTGFSAYVGDNSGAAQSRFLIQIDNNNWYVSTAAGSENVGAASNFETGAVLFDLPFSTLGANWVQLDYDGALGSASSGFQLLSGDISGSALTEPLPAGNITAVGAYLYGPNNAATRIDDFTVIPEPSTYVALFGLLAFGFVAYCRLRK
ncbi:MAG: PEP-CTERM sorting domain-containing protein [Opitutales bacterium]|nr:PEP-CTERM sorting domain-containing protein [Opitutales bacterium]